MTYKIKFSRYNQGIHNTDTSGYLTQKPNNCPLCHYSIDPIYVIANLNGDFDDWSSLLEVIFCCTRKECGSYFISRYERLAYSEWNYIYSLPTKHKIREFSDEIEELSPLFSEIFNQAAAAESNQLDQIAGMGYRKALEFLIKDYLINFKNQDRQLIEKIFLGKCISDYIDNENIKNVAERAVWLGNDEAHYVRKWAEKDVDDLKTLIELVVYWISSEILTTKIIEDMPN